GFEVLLRRRAERLHAGTLIRVRKPNALQRALDRIAGGKRESSLRLAEVLQRVQDVGRQVYVRAGENRVILGGVVIVAAGVKSKAKLQRTIEGVGLGKSEQNAALQVAEVGRNSKRLAQSKKIVGLVVDSNE